MRNFSKCPECNSDTQPAKAMFGALSEFWLECTRCNTFINTYIPQSHQAAVHRDGHRFVGNFGGYGSGKTLTSREEVYKHAFITPHGNTIIGANVQSQYEQTIKRDIEADLPAVFVEKISQQKQFIDLINGHRIMFRPFDDPDKLRSYNLSMFLIVEGSEVASEVYTQLKARLRNVSATVPETDKDGNTKVKKTKTGVEIPIIKADWRKGIIESNPGAGWIRSDVVMKSSEIQKHGDVVDIYGILISEEDPATSSHITATNTNEFLPPTFVDDLIKNKPVWWINRFIKGSFLYAEGLIYPSAMRYIIPPINIPTHWKRIMAYDYGLSDDSVFLFGAVDERHGMLHIYKEVRTNNKNIEELSRLFFEASKDIPVGGWVTTPIIDPKSGPKRDYEKKTLSDHFLDFGISFQPGHIDINARIYRLNTYLESNKIRIHSSCVGLIEELKEYKFSTRKSDSGWNDKPEDKNNHGINALEWITMALPADPRKLLYGVYNREGEDILKKLFEKDKSYAHHVLSDDDEDTLIRQPGPFNVDYDY